jgi:hypothetical protein
MLPSEKLCVLSIHLVLFTFQMTNKMVHSAETFAWNATGTLLDGTEEFGGSHEIVLLVLVTSKVTEAAEVFERGTCVADGLVERSESVGKIDIVGVCQALDPLRKYRGVLRSRLPQYCRVQIDLRRSGSASARRNFFLPTHSQWLH